MTRTLSFYQEVRLGLSRVLSLQLDHPVKEGIECYKAKTTKTQDRRGVGCFDDTEGLMGKVRQRDTNAEQNLVGVERDRGMKSEREEIESWPE